MCVQDVREVAQFIALKSTRGCRCSEAPQSLKEWRGQDFGFLYICFPHMMAVSI